MQVGIVWTGNTIISLSLRGELTYMDAANIASPTMVIRGHNKNITALAADASGGTLVSASYDGILNKFTVGKPAAQVFGAAAACAFSCCAAVPLNYRSLLAKEPYRRDFILQKRPIISAVLLLLLCYCCGVAGSKCSKLKHSERCQLWGGYSQ